MASKSLDRRMRAVCDAYGEEAVRAWVHANLTIYSASRYGNAPPPTRPNIVLHSAPQSQHPTPTVLMDREHPDEASPTPPPAPPQGRGLFSGFFL